MVVERSKIEVYEMVVWIAMVVERSKIEVYEMVV